MTAEQSAELKERIAALHAVLSTLDALREEHGDDAVEWVIEELSQ